MEVEVQMTRCMHMEYRTMMMQEILYLQQTQRQCTWIYIRDGKERSRTGAVCGRISMQQTA
mgnify:CR=1 FL=1